MKTEFKPNPICGHCTGWMEFVYVSGIEYMKCTICGYQIKTPKSSVTPVGEK